MCGCVERQRMWAWYEQRNGIAVEYRDHRYWWLCLFDQFIGTVVVVWQLCLYLCGYEADRTEKDIANDKVKVLNAEFWYGVA